MRTDEKPVGIRFRKIADSLAGTGDAQASEGEDEPLSVGFLPPFRAIKCTLLLEGFISRHERDPWEGGRPRPPFREIANATFAARKMAGEDARPPRAIKMAFAG